MILRYFRKRRMTTPFNDPLLTFVWEFKIYCSHCDSKCKFSDDEMLSILSGTASDDLYTDFRDFVRHLDKLHKVQFTHKNFLGYNPKETNLGNISGNLAAGLINTGIPVLDDIAANVAQSAVDSAVNFGQAQTDRLVKRIMNMTESMATQNTISGNGSTRAVGFGGDIGNTQTPEDIVGTPMKVEYKAGVPTSLKLDDSLIVPEETLLVSSNADGRIASADLACVLPNLPPSAVLPDIYWKDTFIPNLQSKAQAAVNFNADAALNFDQVKITDYLNLIMEACAKYFFVANTYSLLQSVGSADNARQSIRRMFATRDLELISMLKERLDELPIPPEVIAQSSFLYSLYKTNMNSDCSNTIGFTPVPLLRGTDPNTREVFTSIPLELDVTLTQIGRALSDKTKPLTDTVIMLGKCFPEWKETRVNATQSAVEYSHEFNAIFFNSPGVQSDYGITPSGVFHFPSVSNANELSKFAVTGKYDQANMGHQQAVSGMYMAGDWTGTLTPVKSMFGLNDTRTTNRYTYINHELLGPSWVASNYVDLDRTGNVDKLQLRQPYTHRLLDRYVVSVEPFSAYLLRGNSVNAQSRALMQWLSILFDIERLDNRIAKSGSGSRKSYRGKKKK